ncbi:MAG TPA: GNAT family N-acetyltransferase [Devosiaceae bacterium]|nr:GNAT family N-acetyltransferase [Devosiaceae bacterium]
MSVTVRAARPADVEAMSEVLTASIRDLCEPDHGGDAEAIARWTANKTPEAVAAMLADDNLRFYVAERDGAVAAVGCIIGRSEIGLNYVHPAHRFAGASKALLAAMEAAIRAEGGEEAPLVSTVTAHRFYLAAGWEDGGPPEQRFQVACQPMCKRL